MDKAQRLCRSLWAYGRFLWKFRGSRVYLASGMQRSGSTLLYNIIRVCLEERFGENVSGGWIRDIDAIPARAAVVLKDHDLNRLVCRRADGIFYSYRDVRDAAVSLWKKFGHAPDVAICRKLIANQAEAERLRAPMFRFEDFAYDVPGAVREVCSRLGIEADAEALAAKVPAADVGEERGGSYDQTTLLHGKHGTGTGVGGWRSALEPALAAEIEADLGWWFDRYGYPRG